MIEGEGIDLEILPTEEGLAVKIRGVVVPLLPEPDGRWLAEGANGWLTPDPHTHRLHFDWIGFESRVYAR